jgi:drug/metabolite transporter (DMT)-like permease
VAGAHGGADRSLRARRGGGIFAAMQPMRTTSGDGAGRTDLLLFLLVLIWAVNFSVIKVALAQLEPLAFNALRFPLAALLVLGVLRRRGPLPRPARADVPRIVALGLLGNVFYQFFFIHGIDATLAGNASLLLAASPILTALLSAALGHERVGPAVWLGVLATVAGMALVVLGGAAGVGLGLATLRGDLLMIGAAAAWAAYTVGSRPPIARYGSVAVTAWTLWVGTVGVVLVGIPDLAGTDWAALTPSAWLALAYAGPLGIGVAYLLWYQGVRRIGNTRTATYTNLVPVVALGVAWAWLGERPSIWQLAGAAVIIGGISLARRHRTDGS